MLRLVEEQDHQFLHVPSMLKHINVHRCLPNGDWWWSLSSRLTGEMEFPSEQFCQVDDASPCAYTHINSIFQTFGLHEFKKKRLEGRVIGCTQRSTSLVLNMLVSMCCCDDDIFATLDKMNDETSPTLLKLSHTRSCFCSRCETWEFWCFTLLADAPNNALNLPNWTSSSGICHFVHKYFFLGQAVNDDLVLKTMGISLNKSERWLSTDTVQINNVAVRVGKGAVLMLNVSFQVLGHSGITWRK